MPIKRLVKYSLLVVVLAAAGHRWVMAETLVLHPNQAHIVELPGLPGAITVANPNIANVTARGTSVVFHPRSLGMTEIVILDKTGARMADYQINVRIDDSAHVTVFKAGQQETYTCDKARCDGTAPKNDEDAKLSGSAPREENVWNQLAAE